MKHSKIRPPGYSSKTDEAQIHRDIESALKAQTNATIIAENITVSGSIFGTGDVLIYGTVAGKIIINGAVTVAGKGAVKGPIQADAVYVAGSVEGDITAKKCLHLKMTGSIVGDVVVSSFTIEDGGVFNGRSKMTKPGEEPVILY